MFKALQGFNTRLSLVILLITVCVMGLLGITTRVSYEVVVGHSQAESLQMSRDVFKHPEFEFALEGMPESLASSFLALRDEQEKMNRYFSILERYRWFSPLAIFVILGPLIFFSAIFVGRYVTAPMRGFAEAARRLALGDFGVRTAKNTRYWDKQSLALAEDFNAMASSLEQLENERQSMIGDIAHELRTPITSIQLQLEVIRFHLLLLIICQKKRNSCLS